MAEQDKYGSHWGSKPTNPTSEPVRVPLPNASGAEQDRYASHWGSKADNPTTTPGRLPVPNRSGAEQDLYGSHFSQGAADNPTSSSVNFRTPNRSGAEQDLYGPHFSRGSADNPTTNRIGIPVGRRGTPGGGAEQDVYGGHFNNRGTYRFYDATAVGLGLVRHTILPSLGLHTGLSLATYGISRSLNRVDGKDWLWPVAPVVNAWVSALGRQVTGPDAVGLGQAWSSLPYTDKLLLGGITAWGARLFLHVSRRSITRGHDDARHTTSKSDPKFWDKALLKNFLPEALMQVIIGLPFAIGLGNPYAAARGSLSAPVEWAHGAGVFLFSAGFALEVLADLQLAKHKEGGKTESAWLKRDGVWSVVRHPNYLGDILTHLSFPLLLLGSGRLHPLVLLGPIANYVVLRYLGGDAENEASQEARYEMESPLKAAQLKEYRREKNSVWPRVQELANPWLAAVVGVGAVAVVAERALRP